MSRHVKLSEPEDFEIKGLSWQIFLYMYTEVISITKIKEKNLFWYQISPKLNLKTSFISQLRVNLTFISCKDYTSQTNICGNRRYQIIIPKFQQIMIGEGLNSQWMIILLRILYLKAGYRLKSLIKFDKLQMKNVAFF